MAVQLALDVLSRVFATANAISGALVQLGVEPRYAAPLGLPSVALVAGLLAIVGRLLWERWWV